MRRVERQYTYNLVSPAAKLPITLNNLQQHLEDDTIAPGLVFEDTGVANVYVLNAVNVLDNPTALTDGLRIRFTIVNTNTGASTADVAGLGAKSIFLPASTTPITAGILQSFVMNTAVFSSADDGWKLIKQQNLTTAEKEADYLTLILKGVVAFAESYTKRDFITKTYETFRDSFFGDFYHTGQFTPTAGPLSTSVTTASTGEIAFEIRKSPLQSVTSIDFLLLGVLTPVSPTIFYNTFEDDFSKIINEPGELWPTDVDPKRQSVKILFKAGFGDEPDDVPEQLRNAMLIHAAHMFFNRGDCTVGNCPCGGLQLPAEARTMYDQFRIWDIGF